MEGVAAGKRRAEEQMEAKNKKSRTTPRSARATKMAQESSAAEETGKLFDDLKTHINKTSKSTEERLESLISSMDGRVNENTSAIRELREMVKKIESGISANWPKGNGSETGSDGQGMPGLQERQIPGRPEDVTNMACTRKG